MADTLERVRAIVAHELGVLPEEVVEGSTFVDELGADSLDTIKLLMAFEDEFSMDIPDEAALKMDTVRDAVAWIEGHKT